MITVGASAYPRIIDPADGRIWTANARVVDGETLSLVGDGGYVLGARALQIRDALRALDRVTPTDMLRVQLDWTGPESLCNAITQVDITNFDADGRRLVATPAPTG